MFATGSWLEAGTENPQGAENSALKKTAPFSFTPLRISENASILPCWTPGKLGWLLCKRICAHKPFEQIKATLGHGHPRGVAA